MMPFFSRVAAGKATGNDAVKIRFHASYQPSKWVAVVCAAVCFTFEAAQAQLTYDADTGSANAQDGTGTGWNTSDANWWNGATNVAWPNANTSVAIFGAGSGAAGTVTVGTVTANGILFNGTGSGSYALSGGTITLAGTTPTITANVNASIGSTLAGSSGLSKTGTGTLLLSAANSYTGGTTISAGTLSVSNAGALGSGNITLNGGTLLLNGVGMSNAITLTATTNTISTVGNYRVLSGNISGTGGLIFGGGSSTPGLTLTNSGNDFQGNVTVNASHFLRLGASNVIPDTATISVAGSLRLDNNVTDTIAGLSGGGNVFLSGTAAATSTLRIGFGDVSSTFSGSFGGAPSNLGLINLEKIGAGTFTLASLNNATASTTTVTAGTLVLTGVTGGGAVTVANGGILTGTGTVRGTTFTAQSGSIIQAGVTTAQGSYGTLRFTPASGSGSFNFAAGSSTILGLNPGGVGDLLNFDGLSAGALTFDGDLIITAAGYVPTSEETFNLLDWTNLSTTTFASRYLASSYGGYLLGNGDDNLGFNLPDIAGSGYGWDISQFIINGSISTVILVPEPGRASLLLGSVCGLLLRRRRMVA